MKKTFFRKFAQIINFTKIIRVRKFVFLKHSFFFNRFSPDFADRCSAGLHDCHAHAICTNVRKSFSCECKDGYRGDGRDCIATVKGIYLRAQEAVSTQPQSARESSSSYSFSGQFWSMACAENKHTYPNNASRKIFLRKRKTACLWHWRFRKWRMSTYKLGGQHTNGSRVDPPFLKMADRSMINLYAGEGLVRHLRNRLLAHGVPHSVTYGVLAVYLAVQILISDLRHQNYGEICLVGSSILWKGSYPSKPCTWEKELKKE